MKKFFFLYLTLSGICVQVGGQGLLSREEQEGLLFPLITILMSGSSVDNQASQEKAASTIFRSLNRLNIYNQLRSLNFIVASKVSLKIKQKAAKRILALQCSGKDSLGWDKLPVALYSIVKSALNDDIRAAALDRLFEIAPQMPQRYFRQYFNFILLIFRPNNGEVLSSDAVVRSKAVAMVSMLNQYLSLLKKVDLFDDYASLLKLILESDINEAMRLEIFSTCLEELERFVTDQIKTTNRLRLIARTQGRPSSGPKINTEIPRLIEQYAQIIREQALASAQPNINGTASACGCSGDSAL